MLTISTKALFLSGVSRLHAGRATVFANYEDGAPVSSTPLRATAQKILAGSSNVNIVILGDSTGNAVDEWVYRFFDENIPALYPTHSVVYHMWNDGTLEGQGGSYDAPVTIFTGSGPRTIHVYNASVPGASAFYMLASKFQDGVVATNPDLVIWNQGQNHVTSPRPQEEFVAAWDMVRLALPTAYHSAILQNPQRTNNLMAPVILAVQAAADLYGDVAIVDVYSKFIALGKAVNLYAPADIVHPSVTGSPSGTDLYIQAMAEAWAAARGNLPVTPAFLSSTATNYIPNGTFSAFASALPDGWTNGGSAVTVAKELTIVAPGSPYSVKLSGTTGGDRIQRVINDSPTLTTLRGQRVTLAVKMYIAPGSTGTTGRINMQTTGTGGESITTRAFGMTLDGGWVWQVIENLLVPTDCSAITIRLYCDTAANAGSIDYYDRAVLVLGDKPRNAA